MAGCSAGGRKAGTSEEKEASDRSNIPDGDTKGKEKYGAREEVLTTNVR